MFLCENKYLTHFTLMIYHIDSYIQQLISSISNQRTIYELNPYIDQVSALNVNLCNYNFIQKILNNDNIINFQITIPSETSMTINAY